MRTELRSIHTASLCALGLSLALPLLAADFNNDSQEDWVAGSPYEDNNAIVDAGAVTVGYNSYKGSTQLFYKSQTNDHFGAAIAIGNFNGDNYDDIAVAMPFHKSAGGAYNAGAVVIFYGAINGFDESPYDPEYLDEDTYSVASDSDSGEFFGYSLAAGDFDRDGYDDLVVGVPNQFVGVEAAGAIHVFYGSIEGFIDDDDQLVNDEIWDQNSAGVLGTAEYFDQFGWALAVGDFDGDSYDDIAIGSPREDYGAIDDGAVNVLYGSSSGITSSGNEYFGEAAFGGTPEDYDNYGYSLVAGNFGIGTDDDLAIGGPGEDIESKPATNAGAVGILFGDNGLDPPAAAELLQQALPHVGGGAETGDQFGLALAAGYLTGDNVQQLIVGIKYEDISGPISGASDAGMVQVFYPTWADGFIQDDGGVDDETVHQNTSGIEGKSETSDYFGAAIGVCDLDNDGYQDLLVGVPGEEATDGPVNAGYIQKIHFGPGGFTTDDELISEDSLTIDGRAEAGDQFGSVFGH